jgi:hypothetical protein
MQEPAKTQPASTPAKPEQGKADAPATKPSVQGESKAPASALKQTAPEKAKQEAPEKKTEQPAILPFPPQQTIPMPTNPLLAPNAGVPAVPIKQHEPFRVGSILEPALWLVGALVILALILAWLKRYQQKDDLENRDSAHQQLAKFRMALDNGEMSEEEFRKVKSLLTEKIREAEPNAPKKPSDVLPGAPPEPMGESSE